MTSAAPQDTYGSQPWGNSPGSNAPWGNQGNGQWRRETPPWGARPWAPFWYPDGINRPLAIALTILGFIFWWPVGLAILFYLIGSGRMSCFGRKRRAWQSQSGGQLWDWRAWTGGTPGTGSSSGNHAFDEYKAETLRRLEEEQKDFAAFLERLRFARDKAEFDQFMADRRNAPPASPPQSDPQPQA
ncbi:MAG: DUF2852 domain-containing protein [Rhodopila sp.]